MMSGGMSRMASGLTAFSSKPSWLQALTTLADIVLLNWTASKRPTPRTSTMASEWRERSASSAPRR